MAGVGLATMAVDKKFNGSKVTNYVKTKVLNNKK